jgi:DNA adenine methylase
MDFGEQPVHGRQGQIVVPFLKWAGGKRWLTTQQPDLFPRSFDRYIEPFLGSGAVYFHLKPSIAILSDANAELISTYVAMQQDWRKVRNALLRHSRNHSEEYYYEERSRKRRSPYERAAQLIYLNRTCWNGLYRVNRQGQFNVPKGTKTSVLLESDDFGTVSKLLKRAELRPSDFEATLKQAGPGDFLFVDPPYVTRHNLNGFVKYNDKIFSWSDQERLRLALGAAADRGAMILVTNAEHHSVRTLYSGFGKEIILSRSSVLAADSENRGSVTELAIAVNYEARCRP